MPAQKKGLKKSGIKKKGLGRGLTALLGNSKVESMIEPSADDDLREIDVDLIHRGPWQPRVYFDEEALQELADSISAQGVIQPIVVRKTEDGRYEIVAGERRWRATQKAGLASIPAVVKNFNDQTAAAVSLIENIQRENLNPLEESTALKRLVEEFSMTHLEVAETVGRSRASVSNLLRLQELNQDVKQLLAEKIIDMGHARALLAIEGAPQSQIARQVVQKKLSVRETEALVRKQLNPTPEKKVVAKDPDVKKLEDRLSESLGAPVCVRQKTKGKGTLEISYSTLDILEGIINRIDG